MYDLPPHLWLYITRFGGVALTLPLALAIALWLALGYTWQLAIKWLMLLGTAMGIAALTKISFLGWGLGVHTWNFTGISGHTLLSTAVYPVSLFLIAFLAQPPVRVLSVLLGLAIGLAVGLSRIVLDAHSLSEVIAGFLVGALVAIIFIGWSKNAQPSAFSAMSIAISLLMLTVALHDMRVPTQRWLTHIALYLSNRERPFIRARWQANTAATHPTPATSTTQRSKPTAAANK